LKTRLCLTAVCLTLAACNSDTELVATESDALLGAQCTFEDFRAQADACFATFEACASADGADIEPCHAALRGCLPPPPRPPPPPGGDHACDGGHDHPPPPPPPEGADGGRPPPPPGGAPPPPPPGGGHRPPPLPDPAAVHACRDAFVACLNATPTDTEGCRANERTCIGAAFEAAFLARCDEAATRCANPDAPADTCAEIAARCAEGVQGPPEGATCQ
jgi:hypothetical protein